MATRLPHLNRLPQNPTTPRRTASTTTTKPHPDNSTSPDAQPTDSTTHDTTKTPASQADPGLVARVLEIFARGGDSRAAVEEACRVIAMSESGAQRLVADMLTGDAESFHRGLDRGFGKARQVIDINERREISISLEGASPALLALLRALALREVRGVESAQPTEQVLETSARRALPAASGKTDSVNSDASKEPEDAPLF